MTEIAFHFNAPDKLAYACRLLRKAVIGGAQVVVTGEDDALRRLDQQLWTFSPLDFVPHCLADSPAAVLQATPVVLAADLQRAPHHQVLVNLGDRVPEGFERFARLIEVVSGHDEDRAGARERWRHYAARGYAIVRHDLELKDSP
ncbi:DNA polymerase III subunit chi [Pseudorhodoferax sp. Leaf267]|uniref:DNA polymerase III subunit chi n=1 Tax=Pseudorhodoferax sp. Leaf267 TaxID=1736316 RepID=UPI000700DE9B|nr:DNA polymerase III subunit chi [Pseudorhodoferax sp. Leaf267]KQP15060.1 DNA polymerase III subunit chi [Pseudorhodoferax sp. Leaf267]